jgi:hypothetical protein
MGKKLLQTLTICIDLTSFCHTNNVSASSEQKQRRGAPDCGMGSFTHNPLVGVMRK